ncbi:MAG: SMI1/KNR4 family protein [Alphaproteobacteria bacterium]|jgi:hypothetical protein
MKNIIVIDSETKLTKTDLNLLEKKIGINLPVEYKNFLILHNGGHPKKDCYPMISTVLDGADIAWFLACYEGEHENLLKEFSRFKGIIPEEFIPIARGSGGNKICLGVSGNVFGKVYFFVRNWEIDENGQPIPDEMCTIANNFTDFINSLYSIKVEGKVNEKGIFLSSKYIDKHDKYSLPFSTEAKKHGSIVTDFFSQAPIEVEDYIIERVKKANGLTLKYEVKSENKKYCRKIFKDGQIKDYQEAASTPS